MQRNANAFRGSWVATFVILFSSIGSAQEYSYANAFIHYLDGEVTLQRATSPETEPSELNTPILPGDRLWTHSGSRAEIELASGTIVRLDEDTKVDFVAFDSEPTLLLWNGSAIVKVGAAAPYVRIDTPVGSVAPRSEGTYRVDVKDGTHVTLTVQQGDAELASTEGSVVVRSGETSVLEAGKSAESPYASRTSRADAFDRWSEAREVSPAVRRAVPLREVPDEVHPYVNELSDHGEWHSDGSLGYVWYPSVSVGWAPYRYGHWGYTPYGYTWISTEPWGWAPYHYGRWGHNPHGWYWVPGAHWGPAWVSFAIGPTWIGWSPLGHHGHFGHFDHHTHLDHHGHHGHFDPHGLDARHHHGGRGVPRDLFDHDDGWNFVRSREFGKRGHRTRLRARDLRDSAAGAELHAAGAILDRDLTPHAIDTSGPLLAVHGRRRPPVRLGRSPGLRRRPGRGANAMTATPNRSGGPSRAGARPSAQVPRSGPFARPRRRGREGSNPRAQPGTRASEGPSRAGTSAASRSRTRTRGRSNVFRAPSPTTGPRPRSIRRRAPARTTPRHPTTGVRNRSTTRATRPSGMAAPGPTRTRPRGRRRPQRTHPAAVRPNRRSAGRARATPRASPSRPRSSGARIRHRGSQRSRSPRGVRPSRGGQRSPSRGRGARSSGRGRHSRSGRPRNRN